MAGLMSMAQQAPDPAAPPEQDPAAAPAPDDGEESNVTPEEQAQYDLFVKNGMEIIYPDGKVSQPIMEQLGADDPIEALARTTVGVVMGLKQSAERADKPVSDDVLYHGGVELLEQLGEVSEAAGIHDYTQEELEGSLYRALDLFREAGVQSGDVNEDDLKAQFGEIQKADEAGQIDSVLPGISSAPPPKAEPDGDEEPPAGDEEMEA